MVRVMATGVFDLMHLGHVHYLEEARKLGDELWVVVARDSTARRLKHVPITAEDERRDMVAALKAVDVALLGNEGNIFDILDEVRPDVIALGYDQAHDEALVREEAKKRGLPAEVIRLSRLETDLDGTRKIIRKVVDWYHLQERLKEVEGRGDEADRGR